MPLIVKYLLSTKQPVEEAQQRAVRRAVIHRAADKQTVGLFQLFGYLVDQIVLYALSGFPAVVAAETAADFFAADLDQLGFDPLGVQRFDSLLQRAGGAAADMGAAVDDKNLHITLSFAFFFIISYPRSKDKENLSDPERFS